MKIAMPISQMRRDWWGQVDHHFQFSTDPDGVSYIEVADHGDLRQWIRAEIEALQEEGEMDDAKYLVNMGIHLDAMIDHMGLARYEW